jgi:uncharacterized membrane protein
MKMDDLNENRSGLIGAGIGVGLALCLILFGVLKTLFLLLLGVAGFYVGRRFFSNRKEFREILDRLLPPGRFR